MYQLEIAEALGRRDRLEGGPPGRRHGSRDTSDSQAAQEGLTRLVIRGVSRPMRRDAPAHLVPAIAITSFRLIAVRFSLRSRR